MSTDQGVSLLNAFDDEVAMTSVRRRALVTVGLGEFVDGYALIVISGALLQLQPHFHLNAGEVGWLSASAFFGSAVGALFFGDLADRIGRRRVFVLNLIAFVGLSCSRRPSPSSGCCMRFESSSAWRSEPTSWPASPFWPSYRRRVRVAGGRGRCHRSHGRWVRCARSCSTPRCLPGLAPALGG